MNIIQSIILGLVQGLTEFLPVSSTGHLLIARDLLGLDITSSLSFDVFIQLGSLLAVILRFRGDLIRLVKDFFSNGLSTRSNKLLWALILGTIPAAVAGYFWGDALEEVVRAPHYVAYALIAGSIIFFFADQIPKGEEGGVNPIKGLFIGIFQMLALVPGASRSGMTISGGLFFGLSREEAIKFSFLLSIPIMLGAALKTALGPTGITLGDPNIWVGLVVAFIFSWWSIKFLLRYLSKHSFAPFIVYRLVLAAAILYFL
jgi:undecaprenyl-diphosphatase